MKRVRVVMGMGLGMSGYGHVILVVGMREDDPQWVRVGMGMVIGGYEKRK